MKIETSSGERLTIQEFGIPNSPTFIVQFGETQAEFHFTEAAELAEYIWTRLPESYVPQNWRGDNA